MGMHYYMAPLEAITTYTYRQAHAKVYGPLDKYFIPFLETHEKRDFKTRELQEILPEHNEGIYAVPQILTNKADGFIRIGRALKDYGYQEVNLNLGCPSKTVVTKGKGSGFLAFPEELDRFLDEIFEALGSELKLSVKTRIGKERPEEFPRLLEIFNHYPLEELIIHPRVQTDGYKNHPRMEMYDLAAKESKNPICYNGDLFNQEKLEKFQRERPDTDCLMIGRGFLMNQGLLHPKTGRKEFWEFHDLVYHGYLERDLGGYRNVLFKMKELWLYQVKLFPEVNGLEKKIKKLQTQQEYEQLMGKLQAVS